MTKEMNIGFWWIWYQLDSISIIIWVDKNEFDTFQLCSDTNSIH